MSMMGEIKFFLGLQVHQPPGGIFINQSQYTLELFKKHGMDGCDSISTPMTTARIDADLQGTATDQIKYHSIIEGLMYLTASRQNIAFATVDCTSMPTAEAEYLSLSACCAQVIWMTTQLLDYGYRYTKIIKYCDSKSAIAISSGTLSRYKARLVANGSIQLEAVDDETFSPVVKPDTILTVLSLAVSQYWSIHQLDVKNAFVHDDLSETVYMHQPLGFRDSTYPDHVCLLQWSIYGLKHGMDTAYLLSYVDDIVLTASSQPLLQGRKYDVEILKKTHMVDCNSSRTPVDTESKLGDDGDPVSDPTIYRSLAEAEYRGVANAVAETCWLRNLLRKLHKPLSSATLVYCDNVNAVYLFCNPVQHQRTKHIEIHIHFVHDLNAAGEVQVLHVPSCYQYADIFTKGLPPHCLKNLTPV
uniref:Ribonuclease H-like domain-containing protein n=1 Tax=Tanacetum cinerariifolium TaxID=118510 RepID=A0A6L2KD68_TANCI|nr:ribonuclease H-like domain-containing protein [Tanacetum cinerariifolium]